MWRCKAEGMSTEYKRGVHQGIPNIKTKILIRILDWF